MKNTIFNKIIAFAVILIALPFFNLYGTPLALLNTIKDFRK